MPRRVSLLVVLVAGVVGWSTAARGAAVAVPTFESVGLYWTPPSDPGADGCQVRYRQAGATAWRDGYPLWFDSRIIGGRSPECRGSLVHLRPGTSYEVELGMPGQSFSEQLTVSTWSETFPIGETVEVPSGSATLAITAGGSAAGYALYTAPAGAPTTIDVGDGADSCVTIGASYVIVRGLTLKGARTHAIRLLDGVHDVVIEGNDISGWGAVAPDGWAVNYHSAVFAEGPGGETNVERVVVQRNLIHHPRGDTNHWGEPRPFYADNPHPVGPQGVSFTNSRGNHVIRYNEIYSDEEHYFNDGLGGGANFSAEGYPGPDSDVYGNRITHCWDDAIEAEGGGRNVRVWGNYFDQTTTGVASSSTSVGPIYIFRNVYNRSRYNPLLPPDSDGRLYFGKAGSVSPWGGGRRYFLHNTLLQAPPLDGSSYTMGAGSGIAGNGTERPIENTVTRNNIWHIHKDWWSSIETNGGAGNSMDYDLYNGDVNAYTGAEAHGIQGTPTYQAGHGWVSEAGGRYQLDSTSPGHDVGERLASFNDDYLGAGPDMGAAEAGGAPLEFGVHAHETPAVPDGGVPDGGAPDGGAPDGGAPDAGVAGDAGPVTDAAPPGDGPGATGDTVTGCGCRMSAPRPRARWLSLLALAVLVAARRRRGAPRTSGPPRGGAP